MACTALFSVSPDVQPLKLSKSWVLIQLLRNKPPVGSNLRRPGSLAFKEMLDSSTVPNVVPSFSA